MNKQERQARRRSRTVNTRLFLRMKGILEAVDELQPTREFVPLSEFEREIRIWNQSTPKTKPRRSAASVIDRLEFDTLFTWVGTGFRNDSRRFQKQRGQWFDKYGMLMDGDELVGARG